MKPRPPNFQTFSLDEIIFLCVLDWHATKAYIVRRAYVKHTLHTRGTRWRMVQTIHVHM